MGDLVKSFVSFDFNSHDVIQLYWVFQMNNPVPAFLNNSTSVTTSPRRLEMILKAKVVTLERLINYCGHIVNLLYATAN